MRNTRRAKKRPAERIRPMAEPWGSIVDQASEADRVWFEQHPGVNVYSRPIVPGEFGPIHAAGLVTVTQIKPGVRHRSVWVPNERLN